MTRQTVQIILNLHCETQLNAELNECVVRTVHELAVSRLVRTLLELVRSLVCPTGS